MGDEVFEVEDLLDYRHADGKDLYLVRWKGYSEPSWEPDENIGSELADLKQRARDRVEGGRKRKRKDGEEKQKKEKKKDKKKRRRGSSDGKKKGKDSSDSEREVMPMPMPGMMPGMMPPMPFLDGKGKGMMPPMMPGKGMPPPGFGKGMPPLPPFHPVPPPWFDPAKGFPGKGFPMKGFGKGFPRPLGKDAAEMQRFASDKKQRLRDFLGNLHDSVGKDLLRFSTEKLAKAKELVEVLRLKLDKNALPIFAPMELLLTDGLCMMWLLDTSATDEDYELLMELCRITIKSQAGARHLLADCMQEVWPNRTARPGRKTAALFSSQVKPGKSTPLALPSLPNAGPEHWRELIVQLYKDHNPNKVGDIDGLMAKYKGRERALYLCICEKYRVSPNLEKGAQGAHTEDKKVKKYRDLITEIYKEHNPSKLSDIEGLLQKYKGREELVYKGICEKYRVEPKTSKKEEAKSSFEKYKQLIAEIYEEHNKEKLGELDDLLGKYKGKEKTLYLAVCHKYNIEPKLPATKKKDKKEDDKEKDGKDGKDDEKDKENKEKNSQGEVEKDSNESSETSKLKERLPSLLKPLMEIAALHAGLDQKEGKRLTTWEESCPRKVPATLSYRFELQGLSSSQTKKLTQRLGGTDQNRWAKLKTLCEGTELKGPPGDAEDDSLTVAADGPVEARKKFDKAVVHLTDALGRGVRECMDEMDSDNEGAQDRWYLPWSCEENDYILQTEDEKLVRKEVGVEYRRGCWTPRRYIPMHSHSAHHSLCGPDVQRLPDFWRELADKLWLGILTLNWGTDVPLETVVIIQTTGGHDASPPLPGMPQGCQTVLPSAAVIVTAPSAEELEQTNRKLAPLLNRALAGLRANAAFAMHLLSMPQLQPKKATWYPGMVLAAREGVDQRDVASSDSDAPDEDFDPDADILSDAEATDVYRPLRLTRMKIREAFLQGMLCLNCDSTEHRHQDCPFRKKVCWNCHGNHSTADCTLRCRFTTERSELPMLDSVKKVCRRVTDWKKSKSFQEQRNVLALLEQLMIKLEGFADIDLAKHNKEVQDLVKQLNEHTTLFPVEIQDVAFSILDMKAPSKQPTELPVPPPPSTPAPKPYVAPKLPKDPPPPMPENKYPWQEKIFLDSILSKGLYGSNVLSRVIGRGGMHHRRMESESGARVFFRGLGVSGRDMELTDPTDCRLHISVKGEVPQQGKSVRRIIKEIVAELDSELAEKGDAGPALDNPRMPDAHPFGFMLPRFSGPESGEPLKFRFPEEDGQTLNDMLLWLKQANLPIELDSDTQWRTTLQVTPAEPPLPDDAPEQAEIVALGFSKMMREWSYPSPYWFEEHDLRPTGLWATLTTSEGATFAALQPGQGVRLSAMAVDHFATVLVKSQTSTLPKGIVVEVLKRLRGVIRRQVEDEQLLLYLLYPWAWFSESMRQLKLPYGREKVHEMLADLGRLGGKPTESQVSPPFRGFYVEWLPLKAGSMRPELPHFEEEMAPEPTVPVPVSSAPRGFCKYWLPEAAFSSRQDLRELITGPGGSHFAHVLRKYPSVDLRIEGQATLSVPPAHRLHVSMSSEDSEVFENASADVLDLVQTVCDMIGEELQMEEDQLDALIAQIRTEKYFEAHGIRTPLPAARVAVKEEAEFEFVDDEMEMEDDNDDADTEDEDARTEASDCMSDVTEADGEVPKTVFDDI